MFISLTVLFNNKYIKIEPDVSDLKKLEIFEKNIKYLDSVIQISITEDIIIVTTQDPFFRKGTVHFKSGILQNDINAYDFEGNLLWNISDIVKDAKERTIYGGCVVTKKKCGFREATAVSDEHHLFVLHGDDRIDLIDLEERKVVGTKYGKF